MSVFIPTVIYNIFNYVVNFELQAHSQTETEILTEIIL